MNDDVVIKVENISKIFCRSLKRSMFYGTQDALKTILGFHPKTDTLRPSEFWALKDISFELKRGERLGLIGGNGSGKTTLLRLLTGIFPPDSGKISVRGRLGALLAVSAGFHPHMTGRENVFLNGTILGMGQKEISRKLDSIIDFAELPDTAIDAPVSTYSSGMGTRLGFSVAVHLESDLLLIDEVLAVGDQKFVLKCHKKIADLTESGVAIILVSHNTMTLQSFTKKLMLLDRGKLISYGNSLDVLEDYNSVLYARDAVQGISDTSKKIVWHPSMAEGFTVTGIQILPDLERQNSISYDEPIEFIIEYEAMQEYKDIFTNFMIRLEAISDWYSHVSNGGLDQPLDIPKGHGRLHIIVPPLWLSNQNLEIGVSANYCGYNLIQIENISVFSRGDGRQQGIARVDVKYEIEVL